MKRDPSSSSDSSLRNILDLMRDFAEVRARAMFGGHGLYRDGLMFALLADGGLYFKVDEQSRPVFAARDLRAFSFMARGRAVQLSYHEAPPEAMEDKAEMANWCRLAWQSALRARAAAGKNTKRSARGGHRVSDADAGSMLPAQSNSPLTGLPNLGPSSLAWLAAAGITSLERLRALGAVRAFALARAHNRRVSLNLLWAIEGALTGRRWQDVAETDRASLLMALEDVARLSVPDGESGGA